MKKLITLLLFVLSLCPAVFAAEKPLGVEEFTSTEELALSLSSYFPKVQGEVKTVQGDRLTLAFVRKDELIPGMAMTLWREGREILHPVTKAVIGRAEEEVGTIEVVSVGESSVTAVVKKKKKDVSPGDRARTTPRKINMALVPLREEHPDIVKALADNLNELGRFNVLDTGKVDVFLKNSKTRDAAVVRELGSTFGLDAVVSLGIYPSEGRLMVTARIFYTDDASQLDTVVAMLDLKAGKGSLGEIKPFFTPTREEKTITPELPFMAQSFVAADFDGDGRLEYAFSDGSRLHIYRNEPSGWREVWTETATSIGATMEWEGLTTVTRPGTVLQNINIDSADINGNGRPEVFVSMLRNDKVISSVFEFQNGTFSRIAELPGFSRVVSWPGKGTILLIQDYDAVQFHRGLPRQHVWSQGAYRAEGEVRFPKDLSLYGWTFANLGEAQPLLVALDAEDRLLVYSGDSVVWKSVEQYPVVDVYVYPPATGVGAILAKQSGEDKGQRVRLRGRLVALDVNGDGKDEIILPKNITGTFTGGFSGAELNGLSWNGARLDPAWSIKDIPGPVFDFRSMTPDQSGVRINALVRTQGGLFTKDRQQVMIYTVR
ncbi:MAG: hypothetical protein A2078_00405 [Nitrospirae bacterium GWC2_57_9]|nr:MAG: hypothetical protein A2078_00405 [Nitrospirae bacterium GWC2_57_9]